MTQIIDISKRPATLDTDAAGRSLLLTRLTRGRYIWHDGAFRLVTAVQGRTVHMAGGHILRSREGYTVEVPQWKDEVKARRAEVEERVAR